MLSFANARIQSLSRRPPAASLAATITLIALASPSSAVDEITHPFQGVTLIHRTETSPRNLDIWVALIDTLAPGIRFAATPESPHANDAVVSQTTRAFMTNVSAQLAINGDFYSSAGVINGLEHKNPSGFAASAANIFSTFDPSRPAFHVGKNSVAHIVTGSGTSPSPAVPVWNAVGGSDFLINNGALPTYWNNPSHPRYTFANELHPRTAIAINADRSRIAMFVVDGRQSDSGGMKFPEIANMLRNDYGMHWAINLDGGGSTSMAIDEYDNGDENPPPRVLNDPSDGPERSVANSLALFARPMPPPVPSNARLKSYQQESGGYGHTAVQIAAGDATNRGGTASFRVGYDTVDFKSRGVLSFDLSGIPSHATIHSASLSLDAFSVTGATNHRHVDLEVYRLTDPIAEDDATWTRSAAGNNWSTPGGDFSGTPLTSLVAQQTTGLKTFVSTVDFVAAAQQAVASGSPLSLLVTALEAENWGAANASNLNMRFRSDDATTGQRPMLAIQYTFAPTPGDFNQDGYVNMGDYVAWRKGVGTVPIESQYQLWRSKFGEPESNGGSSPAVPEPEAWTLFAALLAAICRRFHRACDWSDQGAAGSLLCLIPRPQLLY
jgi:hypothetical protein